MNEAIGFLHFIERKYDKKIFNFEYADIGGIAIDNHGDPLPDSTLGLAKSADAILLGAVGGYKWDQLSMKRRPEFGLLRIGKELDLFANIRPIKVFSELIDMSILKKDVIENLDIVIVRELVGALYFGGRRRIEVKDGEEYVYNTMSYKKSEIERIGKIAFEIAKNRAKN